MFDLVALLTIDGIANGAIYVLAGLGIVLIFSVTRIIFVPFGEIISFTAITLSLLEFKQLPGTVFIIGGLAAVALSFEIFDWWRGRNLRSCLLGMVIYGLFPLSIAGLVFMVATWSLPALVQFGLALLLVVPLGPLLNRIAFQPIGEAPVLVLLIVAVAVHFGLSGVGLFAFGPEGFRTNPISTTAFDVFGLFLPAQVVAIIVASVVFSVALYFLFSRTDIGKALRATAINRTGARIVGIRPIRTSAAAFFLASLLGAISGLLIAPTATLYYDSGFPIGLKAFVGAIIGGLTSYPLTAIGAICVGLLESYTAFWNSALKDSVVFGSLLPLLLWRSRAAPKRELHEEEID